MHALLERWKRLRRRWKVTILVGALLLLLAPFVEVEEVDDESGEGAAVVSETTESPAAATAEPTEIATRAPAPASPEPSRTASPTPTAEAETFAEFDESTAVVRIVTKEHLGGQAQVYFVDERPGVDFYDLAIQCMHAELDRGLLSAFCYAFSSMADFEHANVDAELGGMEHLCWRARFSIAIAGNTDGAEDNNAYDVSGCPGP